MRATVPARVCDVCRFWPCRCNRERHVGSPYVEPGIRADRCICGGMIVVYDGSEYELTRAIRAHNATVGHNLWRAGQR
jgi:hypothetical protein